MTREEHVRADRGVGAEVSLGYGASELSTLPVFIARHLGVVL